MMKKKKAAKAQYGKKPAAQKARQRARRAKKYNELKKWLNDQEKKITHDNN